MKMKLYELLREDDILSGGPHAEVEEDAVAHLESAQELMKKGSYAQASDCASKAAKILSKLALDKNNYGTNT